MDREPKEPQLDNPQLDEECNFKSMTDEEIAKLNESEETKWVPIIDLLKKSNYLNIRR